VRHLAVLGSPIAHSLSPALHNAAYRLLGLDYEYGLKEVASGGLQAFLANLDESWIGLSLTMPIKREVIPLLDEASPLVVQLGVANTIVLSRNDDVPYLSGYNTDVDGITRAILRHHPAPHQTATIIGGGATAMSALVAAHELGATRVSVFVRDPQKAGPLVELAARRGILLDVAALDTLDARGPLDFVISTLPGGVELPAVVPSSPEALLLDVAYDPWPSALAAGWEAHGATAVSGLEMLVEQAIGQIRLFTGHRQDEALPDEESIRDALNDTVGLRATR
jgi:shikimate dehydrogenase